MARIEERDHERTEPAPRKVIIAGTGRAGTTLLVQILTDLGLDTGFEPDAPIDDRAAAGLELPATGRNSPRIVKSPYFSRWLAGLLDDGRVDVEHVVIPIRDLDVAAASRVRQTRYGADLHTWGGLFGTSRATRQREALAIIEYELMFTIARHDVPHTLLEFPRFAHDWQYTYQKLSFLDPTVPADRWRVAVGNRVRPEMIHETPLSRRERWLTVAGTTYNRAIVRPVRGAWHIGRDRFAPGVVVSDRDVTAYIANLNTARVTELCIRSMREFAGMNFELVVGDCGSTDGSLKMLERFSSQGWLDLQVAPNGRTHADWLDRWLRDCPTRYALFSDSDVEFSGPHWLTEMLETAATSEAALVCGRMQHGAEVFVHPVTRAERRIAPRPTAWLFMIDTHQVRDQVDATFEYLEVEDFDAFGGKVAYDTGAWYFKELCDAGLSWAEMPDWWQHKYHHFGGLTWLGPTRSGPAWRVRARQAAKLVLVEQHLYRARRDHWGE